MTLRSSPPTVTRPVAVSESGRRPMTASEVRDLPEPDSPMRPTRSPRSMRKARFETSS
jgi:hypothetical protein